MELRSKNHFYLLANTLISTLPVQRKLLLGTDILVYKEKYNLLSLTDRYIMKITDLAIGKLVPG